MLCDPVYFWQIFGTYEGEPIRFDDWQVRHLHDYARLRAREKAPQIGFSWLSALEATWDCIMHDDATDGFVSVDQREASEKILYSKKAYSELPELFHKWVPMSKDSTEELWFGDSTRPSRLMSIPATSAMRGRHMSVYLDEVDFYKDGGHDAKRVAMGRITRGGRVTMGSTCFGVDTELDKTMRTSANFSRGTMPYTVAEKPEVQEAILIAKDELDDEDFEEEYNCVRGGSLSDTFSAELIRRQMSLSDGIPALEFDSRAPSMGAYDVGGSRHPSMITILEPVGTAHRQRVLEEVRGKSLPQQENFLVELLTPRPNLSLVIDAVGIGLHTAQSLQDRFGERIILMQAGSKPDDMAPMDRGEMAMDLRRGLEADELQLLADKEQMQQFHRTRVVKGTAGKLLVQQPGSKKKTHYDKFWTTAYAWYGVMAGGIESVYEGRGLLVIGGDHQTDALGRRKELIVAR